MEEELLDDELLEDDDDEVFDEEDDDVEEEDDDELDEDDDVEEDDEETAIRSRAMKYGFTLLRTFTGCVPSSRALLRTPFPVSA
jgi:hypothetical protein